tara:strand:- start:158 stop:577 length:420 start_codon:yes stop_codon:yes gene_type:complete
MEQNEQKAQEMYAQIQAIEQQIKSYQQQAQTIDNQFVELKMTERSIEEFKNLKEGDEMFVPLNNGIFAKAALKNNKDLLLNVGSKIVVNKKPDEAKELIASQLKEMEQVKVKIQEEIEKLMHQGTSLQKELQTMVGQNV